MRDKQYIDEMLNLAIENTKLPFFIAGVGIYQVEARDAQYGATVTDYAAIMQALYRKYQKNPEQEFLDEIKKSFEFVCVNIKSKDLITVLLEINYHLSLEGEKQTPFTLDYGKLLDLINENLTKNKKMYEQEIYGDFLLNVNSCISSIRNKIL